MNPSEDTATAPVHTPVHSGPSHRALRAMAAVRWVLLALVTLLAASTVWTFWGPAKADHPGHQEARFYCPMHPEIRSPDPGDCPICHMMLEPIPEERRSLTEGANGAASPGGPSPSDVTAITLSVEKQRAAGLITTVAEHASLGDRLRVPGVITAPLTGLSEARVRAPGFVEQVVVRQTGVRVKRGEPLAYIYSPEIYRAQEEYLTAVKWSGAASALGSAAPDAGDLTSAARRGLELLGLSGGDVDAITRTGKPIRAMPVRAPASGYVTRFNAILGSRAVPEMVLYEIADLSTVWVIASVHERDLHAMEVGLTAEFVTSRADSEPLTAKIDLIEPLLDEATRTTRVRLVVPNADGRLRPGQFGDVAFELPPSAGTFVPQAAVIRTGEHAYVYVASGADRFEPRLVKTGLTRDGRVEVLSGVAAGDRVVTRGTFMLDSESRLQASLAPKPPPQSASQPLSLPAPSSPIAPTSAAPTQPSGSLGAPGARP